MAEELPKLLKIELIEHSAVEISDWVKDALEKARELVMSPSEDALSSALIQSAFDYAESGYCSSNMV